MENYIKTIISKLVAKFALNVSIGNVNTCCYFYFNQPEIPDELQCLNKLPDEMK